jgi:hypothetical protein
MKKKLLIGLASLGGLFILWVIVFQIRGWELPTDVKIERNEIQAKPLTLGNIVCC